MKIPKHLKNHFDRILAIKLAFPGAQVIDGSKEVMDIVSTRKEAVERKAPEPKFDEPKLFP